MISAAKCVTLNVSSTLSVAARALKAPGIVCAVILDKDTPIGTLSSANIIDAVADEIPFTSPVR